ncbi:MAG: metallophosphoesterase, partial [Chitinophagaceae bacterium]|nr:metallophosphoesterase [Chitinophagaceae bacterium]
MRRFNLVFLLILIVVLGVIEFYTYSALRFATRNLKPGYRNWITGIYIVITILWLVAVFATPLWRQMILSKALKNVMVSFVMGFLITKVLIALILFIDDIRRVVFWALQYTGAKSEPGSYIHQGMSRSQFMVQFALLFGGTIFGSLLYGMTNRYNYQIRKIKLAFKDLPESFRKLRIIHISDIHSGSLIDKKAVEKGIQMIMDQKPDLILFTGDLVNDRHEEAIDFVPIFSKLKAPLGVYSVLGNHDYGDYVQWPSQTDKINNLNALKDLHRQMGWRLLL